ncbi:MAG: PfkB family carbohydrate kinase, partial [Desulfobacteraceae bacterium]
YALLREDARKALVEKLFPLADVVTPNIHEAEALVGHAIADQDQMQTAAKQIIALGAAKVVVKGGHMAGNEATDILYDGQSFRQLSTPRKETANTHGTGCTFSSAITAYLAKEYPFFQAVQSAKTYITGAIEHALDIGKGHGPTHHFFDLYARAGVND